MRLFSLVLTLIVAMAANGARAEDKAAIDPAIQAVKDKAAELAKVLTKEQAEAMAQINAGFGMTRAVSTARADVSRAVDECSKKNPDLAKDLKKEFTAWSGKVDPLLKDHQKKMKKSIRSGLFENPADIDAYIDLIDKAARQADAKLEKTVVTTPEACQGTREALGRTGDALANLLQEITWPGPAKEDKDADKPAEKKEAAKNEDAEKEYLNKDDKKAE